MNSKFPLHEAASSGNLDAVRQLIEQGVNVNATDKNNGWPPLFYAVAHISLSSSLEICFALLRNGASITQRNKHDKSTVLHVLGNQLDAALSIQASECWELLIRAGAKIDAQNKFGETPLHYCALRNNIPALKLLLQLGAKPNSRNKKKETPLHYATRNGFSEAIDILTSFGSNLENVGAHGSAAVNFDQSFFRDVPADVQSDILSYLSPPDLCCVARTCKLLSETASLDEIWQQHCSYSWLSRKTTKKLSWKTLYLEWIRSLTKSAQTEKVEKLRRQLSQSSLPPSYAKDWDYLFKILVIGDNGTGKTSLIWGTDSETVDFKMKTIQLLGQRVKLQIWDSPRLEPHRNRCSSFYRGAHAYIIVYDTTDLKSYRNVALWFNELDRYGSEKGLRVLAGTKCDLKEARQVPKDAWREFEESTTNFEFFMETSAKEEINIDELLVNTGKCIFDQVNGSQLFTRLPVYVPSVVDFERMTDPALALKIIQSLGDALPQQSYEHSTSRCSLQ